MPKQLCIEHLDFTLKIECEKDGYEQAKRNGIAEENLKGDYQYPPNENVEIKIDEQPNKALNQAIFFDNINYSAILELKENLKNPKIELPLQIKGTLVGKTFYIVNFDYHNDIGKSYLLLSYDKNGTRQHFKFSYTVFSQKLDYKTHWRAIVKDIEEECESLTLEYFKSTFHSFKLVDGESKDIVWWSVFKRAHEKFLRACKSILNRPRHRLRSKVEYKKLEKIKRFTPQLEREFERNAIYKGGRLQPQNENHYYRDEEAILNIDTQENRFLKYALMQIAKRFEKLIKKLNILDKLDEATREDLTRVRDELNHLKKHPFFRTIGEFKGFRQESLILQRATYYSTIYRFWVMLNRSYDIEEGNLELSTKDIATLYELWCFIELKNLIQKIVGIVPEETRGEHANWLLKKFRNSEQSKVIFKKGDIQLAEVIYNPEIRNANSQKSTMGIDENIISLTTDQRPDIVLRLDNAQLTYLFDAKYRLDEEDNEVDSPPEEAINQMHRYRDAIYYCEKDRHESKKEIIGGYILFPGNSNNSELSRFYRSIEQVNIGAFPFRPSDDGGVGDSHLLEKFLRERLEGDKSDKFKQLDDIAKHPHRGLFYTKFKPSGEQVFCTESTKNKNDNSILHIHCNELIGISIQSIRYLWIYKDTEEKRGVRKISEIVFEKEGMIKFKLGEFIDCQLTEPPTNVDSNRMISSIDVLKKRFQ